MEAPVSTFRTLKSRATNSYVTVIRPAPTPIASQPVSSTHTTPTATQHPSSSVSMGTFAGVIVALIIIVIILLLTTVFFYYRSRKRRQQTRSHTPLRLESRSLPPVPTGSGFSTRQFEIPMTPPQRPPGTPRDRVSASPTPYNKSEAQRRAAMVSPPYSNRARTPSTARTTTASPTTPTRARVPRSTYAAPPITISSPPKQNRSANDSQPQRPNPAFLHDPKTRTGVQNHLQQLQMLSDTTDMSTDTMDGPDGPRPVMNDLSNKRYAKAAAKNLNLALLGSDASENPGDDPISQIYESGEYGPGGRRIQGARTWENNGSGMTVARALNARKRAGSEGQDGLERPRPVKRPQV